MFTDIKAFFLLAKTDVVKPFSFTKPSLRVLSVV